ncbi:hypothetical protein NXS19_003646 [Fusarium pseudograminearum]|nr:hypothetical protein NXS19_003646 [Fusarium pseudograminearum]
MKLIYYTSLSLPDNASRLVASVVQCSAIACIASYSTGRYPFRTVPYCIVSTFETRSAQSAPRSNDGGIGSERRPGFRTLHQTDQMRPSQLASPLQITHMSVMAWAALQDPGTSIHNTPKYYIVSTDVILLSLPTSIDLIEWMTPAMLHRSLQAAI